MTIFSSIYIFFYLDGGSSADVSTVSNLNSTAIDIDSAQLNQGHNTITNIQQNEKSALAGQEVTDDDTHATTDAVLLDLSEAVNEQKSKEENNV